MIDELLEELRPVEEISEKRVFPALNLLDFRCLEMMNLREKKLMRSSGWTTD